jgi:hypothetical protein
MAMLGCDGHQTTWDVMGIDKWNMTNNRGFINISSSAS